MRVRSDAAPGHLLLPEPLWRYLGVAPLTHVQLRRVAPEGQGAASYTKLPPSDVQQISLAPVAGTVIGILQQYVSILPSPAVQHQVSNQQRSERTSSLARELVLLIRRFAGGGSRPEGWRAAGAAPQGLQPSAAAGPSGRLAPRPGHSANPHEGDQATTIRSSTTANPTQCFGFSEAADP